MYGTGTNILNSNIQIYSTNLFLNIHITNIESVKRERDKYCFKSEYDIKLIFQMIVKRPLIDMHQQTMLTIMANMKYRKRK